MARPPKITDNKIPVPTHSGQVVSLGRVRQAMGRISTAKHFLPDFPYEGPDKKVVCKAALKELRDKYDSGQITDEDIANYLIDSRRLRGMFVGEEMAPPTFSNGDKVAKGEERPRQPIEGEGLRRRMEERLALYVKAYDLLGAPPNDIALIKSVAFDEVMLEHYQEVYRKAVEQNLESNLSTASLNREITNIQNRLKLNQQSIQIDMKSRRAKDEDTTGVDQYIRSMEEAARFAKQYITYLEHCGTRVAVGIGFFDHPDNQLQGHCPRCNHMVRAQLRVVGIQFDPDADPTQAPEVIYLEQAKVEEKWE